MKRHEQYLLGVALLALGSTAAACQILYVAAPGELRERRPCSPSVTVVPIGDHSVLVVGSPDGRNAYTHVMVSSSPFSAC